MIRGIIRNCHSRAMVCPSAKAHDENTSGATHDGIVMLSSVARETAMSELLRRAPSSDSQRSRRRMELLTFLILAFGIWPLVAVGVVGGYGFIVWMFQVVFGPPGPPAAH